MYLIDTNVISESRKGERCNPGVRRFFAEARKTDAQLYLAAICLGELWRGVDCLSARGDELQAGRLRLWLSKQLIAQFEERILAFSGHTARIWARLMAPDGTDAIDKQIAASALEYDLVLVTRNTLHMGPTGARLLNPFD